METSIEKSENRASHTEPSLSPIETSSPKPVDLSLFLDRMESVNSDIFEEAIEPPVQDKENGNNSTHESVQKAAQEVPGEKAEERDNGELEDFESFGERNSEAKVFDRYLNEVFEELETPVETPKEKFEQEGEEINGGLDEVFEELETPVETPKEKEEETEVINGGFEEGSEGLMEAPVGNLEEKSQEGEEINGDFEELETPVGNSEEKVEQEAEGFNGGFEEGFETPVGNPEEKFEQEFEGFNGGFETPVGNPEQKFEQEDEGFNGEKICANGEQTVGKSEESDELQNREDGALNGDNCALNGEQTVDSDGELNGEIQFIEEIPAEKIIQEFTDALPDLIIKQESEPSDKITEQDGINGELQSDEEIPPEKIIEELREIDPVKTEESETGNVHEKIIGESTAELNEAKNGDVQSFVETAPHEEIIEEELRAESNEVKNGDVQSFVETAPHEEIIEEELRAESNEVKNGDVQSFVETAPHEEIIEEELRAESNEVKNGDVQSFVETAPHEEIIEEELRAESNEVKNGDVQSFTDGFPLEEIIKESREIDPIESSEPKTGELQSNEGFTDPEIITESTKETPTGDLQSNEEITQEPKETLSTPIFELDPEIIPATETNNHQNNNNINSSEAPIIEDIYDSSSSSDNDEKSPPSSNPAPPPVPTPTPAPTPQPARPAGLGSSASLPDPSVTTRSTSSSNGSSHRPASSVNGSAPGPASVNGSGRGPASVNGSTRGPGSVADEAVVAAEPEEQQDEIREKLMNIRVRFLRLVHRLGQTPHNTVVAQVLYRLGLAEQLRRNSTRPVVVSFDRASVLAEQLELSGSDPLGFSCTIMLLGKAGVGKSSTINSLFNDSRVPIHTFGPGTRSVNLISGNIHGINLKIIDTPGLSSSISDTHKNAKILNSIKKFVKKSPPDIVLYFDRLDVQSRDYGDVALLQSITNVFGPSIWFNAIIVLTHAASAPPEGANGTALSYDMFVTQRTHVVQQNIRQAAGDVRLMNPVSLVENHSACRMNRAGKRVLPNGTVWEPQLLLLSFASKILGEANALLKLEDNGGYNNMRGGRRNPPLPYFLSSLLQSRNVVKLPEEEGYGDLDEDLEDELADLDEDLEDEYDDLPPFKRLNKEQLERLSKQQKNAYLDEIEYREKLLFRKQLKEERRRRKLIKKMKQQEAMNPNNNNNNNFNSNNNEGAGDENVDGPGSLPVPMPDMALPASFDSDAPVHRYRYLDSNSQWLVRPVLDLQGWDHDIGYEGLNLERLFVLKNKIPVSVSGQLAKDKKESSLQLDVSSSVRHGDLSASSFGMDLQAIGKDMSYTFRGETRFRNFTRNATSAGGSVTFLGDSVSAGIKLEDKLVVNKQVKVSVTGGAMTARGDVACGARLEASFKDKDYPIGRFLSSLALSAVEWHGDRQLAVSCQSQVPVGRGSNLVLSGNLNNKGSGQIAVRVNSSDQVQFALVALVPFVGYLKRVVFGSGFD